MKTGNLIQIKGITHKTKNRVNAHGKFYVLLEIKGKELYLREANPRDPSRPYGFWGQPGLDFEIIETN